MNTYRTTFAVECPNNGQRIEYLLEIQTTKVILVEKLQSFLKKNKRAFHEDLADALVEAFGGLQTLKAEHHGVLIETVRKS